MAILLTPWYCSVLHLFSTASVMNADDLENHAWVKIPKSKRRRRWWRLLNLGCTFWACLRVGAREMAEWWPSDGRNSWRRWDEHMNRLDHVVNDEQEVEADDWDRWRLFSVWDSGAVGQDVILAKADSVQSIRNAYATGHLGLHSIGQSCPDAPLDALAPKSNTGHQINQAYEHPEYFRTYSGQPWKLLAEAAKVFGKLLRS